MQVKYLNQNKKKGVMKKWQSDFVQKKIRIEGCSAKQQCTSMVEIPMRNHCVVVTDYELFSSSKMLYLQTRQQGHWQAVNDI